MTPTPKTTAVSALRSGYNALRGSIDRGKPAREADARTAQRRRTQVQAELDAARGKSYMAMVALNEANDRTSTIIATSRDALQKLQTPSNRTTETPRADIRADYMLAMMLSPNSLHLTSVAPSMPSRSKIRATFKARMVVGSVTGSKRTDSPFQTAKWNSVSPRK